MLDSKMHTVKSLRDNGLGSDRLSELHVREKPAITHLLGFGLAFSGFVGRFFGFFTSKFG